MPTDTPSPAARAAWVAVLVALVLVGDRALGAGLHAAVMGTGHRFAVLYRGDAPGGALILGNSRGVNTFLAPALADALGRPVFNASANGVPTDLSEVLLYDYVERNPTPDVVVVEVTGLAADADQVVNVFPFADESDRLEAYIEETVSPSVTAARRAFALYDYNGEVLFRSLAAGRSSDQGEINRYTITPALVAATQTMEPVELRAAPRNLEALQRMVAFCRARGIPIRLVVGPYLPAYRAQIAGLDAWVATVGRATGEPVWDYSGAVVATSAFADRVHLNARGARLLTPRLIADGLFDVAADARPARPAP